MKLIMAIIKPFKLDDVREALTPLGVQGLTVSEVMLEQAPFIDKLAQEDVGRFAKTLTSGVHLATPVFDGADEHEIKSALKMAGLPLGGQSRLIDGKSGEPFENPVTVGVMSCIVRPPSVVVNSLLSCVHWDFPDAHWPLATVSHPRSADWKSTSTIACCDDRLPDRRKLRCTPLAIAITCVLWLGATITVSALTADAETWTSRSGRALRSPRPATLSLRRPSTSSG